MLAWVLVPSLDLAWASVPLLELGEGLEMGLELAQPLGQKPGEGLTAEELVFELLESWSLDSKETSQLESGHPRPGPVSAARSSEGEE